MRLVPPITLGNCFFFCRDLRRQVRVEIHLHFFTSLLLSNAISLLWYWLVHHDLLTNDQLASTAFMQNQVTNLYSLRLVHSIWTDQNWPATSRPSYTTPYKPFIGFRQPGKAGLNKLTGKSYIHKIQKNHKKTPSVVTRVSVTTWLAAAKLQCE